MSSTVVFISCLLSTHSISISRLFHVTPDDDVEELKDAVMADVKDGMSEFVLASRGALVHASTLGSLGRSYIYICLFSFNVVFSIQNDCLVTFLNEN
jgi:hypothetical protein